MTPSPGIAATLSGKPASKTSSCGSASPEPPFCLLRSSVGTRAHTSLQPDWFSLHRTESPALCRMSSNPSCSTAMSDVYLARPKPEKMQGSDCAVDVPHEVALLK